MTLVFSIVGIKHAIANDFVSTDASNYDIHDIRSKRVDAVKVANKEYFGRGKKEKKSREEEREEEGNGDVLLIYYESHSDNVFTEAGLAAMKNIDVLVTGHASYPKYCARKYALDTGNWTCELSLTPYKMFYSRVPPSVVDDTLFTSIADMGPTTDCAMTHLLTGDAMASAVRSNATLPACISSAAATAIERLQSNECIDVPIAEMLKAKKLLLQLSYYYWGCQAWFVFGSTQVSDVDLTTIDATLKGYRDTCMASVYAGEDLTGGWDGSATTPQPIEGTLALAGKMMSVPSFKWTVDFFMDKNFEKANLKSKYTRSIGTVRIIRCTLYAVPYTVCTNTYTRSIGTVHCTLYTVRCTLYTNKYTRSIGTVHCTLYTVRCTLYSMHSTLIRTPTPSVPYTVHYTLCTMH
jgi:hypothetical protein